MYGCAFVDPGDMFSWSTPRRSTMRKVTEGLWSPIPLVDSQAVLIAKGGVNTHRYLFKMCKLSLPVVSNVENWRVPSWEVSRILRLGYWDGRRTFKWLAYRMHVVSMRHGQSPSQTPNLPTKNLPTKICWLKLSRKSPMDMRIPSLNVKILLESKPLKSRILLRRLAGVPSQGPGALRGVWAWGAARARCRRQEDRRGA